MVEKRMNRCSTSLIIKKILVKTTMKYHLTQIEWLLSKRQEIINAGKNLEKRKPMYTVSENVDSCSHCGK